MKGAVGVHWPQGGQTEIGASEEVVEARRFCFSFPREGEAQSSARVGRGGRSEGSTKPWGTANFPGSAPGFPGRDECPGGL